MTSNNRKMGSLVWFAAGLRAGIGAAVLFTPVSGPELRNRISAKASAGTHTVSETIESARNVAGESVEWIRERVGGMLASEHHA